MSSIILLICTFVCYLIAYHTYGKFIAKKIFEISVKKITPAHEFRDDIDYVPTRNSIVFGHHFASIAGTGPIVGPAIALIWGWVPAVIWIILGSIVMGAVHDFGTLMLSLRYKGESVGEISKQLISNRVRLLFLLVIFFTVWIVIAVFCLVMAVLFDLFPQAVIPIWGQIPIAVFVGTLIHRRSKYAKVITFLSVIAMYTLIFMGSCFPIKMPEVFHLSPLTLWTIILLVYCYIVSIIPVWQLLQPRDFINAWQLFIMLGLLVIGIFFSKADIVAPAFNINNSSAPPIIPFLFVTVACGAISGFHSLVSSGTTAKQLSKESDAINVGFGGMLVEGIMAIIVIIAISAGLGIYLKTEDGSILRGLPAWSHFYTNWDSIQGLGPMVNAFVKGGANLLNSIGIPLKLGFTVIGVFVASFAGTTLDTATRIQRYIISEFASSTKIDFLKNRYSSTAVAVLSAAVLALSQGGGKGGLILWPLFGTSNQLLAGLSLLVVTVFLVKNRKRTIYTLVPMVLIIIFTGWAMIYNIFSFYETKQWYLLFLGCSILLLEIWMISETLFICLKTYSSNNSLPVNKWETGKTFSE